jgi:CDC45-like protein
MRIPADRRENAYNIITRDALGGGTTVVLFCACDVDSLAASAILVLLFRQDQVKFTQVPVSSRGQLDRAFVGSHITADIRSVVLIGCGGGLDVQALMPRDQELREGRRRDDYDSEDEDDVASRRIAFIFDPFLPYSRANVDNDETVLVFDSALQARSPEDDEDAEESDLLNDARDGTEVRQVCCGKPSAQVMFELSQDLGRTNSKNRWLAWYVFFPPTLCCFWCLLVLLCALC